MSAYLNVRQSLADPAGQKVTIGKIGLTGAEINSLNDLYEAWRAVEGRVLICRGMVGNTGPDTIITLVPGMVVQDA